MTCSLNRMFLEKLGGADPTQFVGDLGEIFYDPATGVLRISDGSTPGGIILGALGSTGYVGAFHDTDTQANPIGSTPRAMRINTTDIADGVQTANNDQMRILHAGNYNIQFSAQFAKADAGEDSVDIWLRKNNYDVEWTGTRHFIQGNNAKHAPAWNWVVSAAANDYFQIMWSSADLQMRISADTGLTEPTRPNVPSIIITVTQV